MLPIFIVIHRDAYTSIIAHSGSFAMIAATISQAPPGSGSRAFAAADATPARSTATRIPASTSQLPVLLREVASEGWNGPAGAAAIAVLQRACRREAPRWRSSAGSLTDEGLGDVWEQIDRLLRSGRFDDAPGLLVRVVRRAYACEAAAAQTGMGSAATRGLIAATDSVHTRSLEDLAGAATPTDEPDVEVPRWMRVLGAVLAAEGWRWPVPALHAVVAAAASVARSGRKHRSPLAGQATGVPPATWSALDLLIFGSGPGCDPTSRTPGVAVQIDLLGAAGLRQNQSQMRIVRAAVAGRPVRTGRTEWVA